MSFERADYTTTLFPTFTNVNMNLGNHYRFFVHGLETAAYYTQSVFIPGVTSPSTDLPNPFTNIRVPGDHLKFAPIITTFGIDEAMQTYITLFGWMKGYGFPKSFEELARFREQRIKSLNLPYPSLGEIQTTSAVLQVLQPDTERILLEFRFTGIFPTHLGRLQFSSKDPDPPILTCDVAFDYTDFDLYHPDFA